MSSPTSVKMAPPLYVDPQVRRRYIGVYLLQIWISLIPAAYMLLWFYYPVIRLWSFWDLPLMGFSIQSVLMGWTPPEWLYVVLTPLYLLLIYVVTVIWSVSVTRIHLAILNRHHPPSEGVFYRSLKDKDYVFWNRRNFARMFCYWVLHSTPFTFLKSKFTYRALGVPIGKNSVVNHAWISPEFVSIGKNVVLGQSAAIYSFQFQDDMLLVAAVDIGDDAMLGPQVILFPGAKVAKGVVIDGGAFAHPFTVFEENGVYHGTPVKLMRKEPPSS